MKYQEYLQTNTWTKQKNKAKYWHGKKCVICGAKKVDIHHKTYINGLGKENPKHHLIPLCRLHHYAIHDIVKKDNINIYQATEQFIKRNKIKKPKTWKTMTPFEREKFLGKAL
jgi:hypothetical protein